MKTESTGSGTVTSLTKHSTSAFAKKCERKEIRHYTHTLYTYNACCTADYSTAKKLIVMLFKHKFSILHEPLYKWHGVCSLIDRRGFVVAEDTRRAGPMSVIPTSQAAASAASVNITNNALVHSTATDPSHSEQQEFVSNDNVPAVQS